jgi:hypothetical protein
VASKQSSKDAALKKAEQKWIKDSNAAKRCGFKEIASASNLDCEAFNHMVKSIDLDMYVAKNVLSMGCFRLTVRCRKTCDCAIASVFRMSEEGSTEFNEEILGADGTSAGSQ